MKPLERVKIGKYRNIPFTDLKDLGKVNILVGPNNSGKTNLLTLISKIGSIKKEKVTCKKCSEGGRNFEGLLIHQGSNSNFLKSNMEKVLELEFSDELIDGDIEIEAPDEHLEDKNKLELRGKGHMKTLHKSVHTVSENRKDIRDISVEFITENRLEDRNCKNFEDFIQNREDLHSTQMDHLEEYLEVTDPRIEGHNFDLKFTFDTSEFKQWDLVRKENIKSEFNSQGSGFRSIGGIGSIIAAKNPDLLLIDEPERGLNPKARYKLLGKLLEEDCQTFIATHDPTFVNPAFIKESDVSVYVHSKASGKFVKINLEDEEPSIFGGYLPHTVGVKEKEIFVEGTTDVHVLQRLLKTYLQDKYGAKWIEEFSKVGIYHLGGSNWRHLIDTVPPGKESVLILDNDMEETVEEISEKISNLKPRNLNEIEGNISKNNQIPVLCHSEDDIKDFFDSENTDKTVEELAEELPKEEIPQEFIEVFGEIFRD